VLIDALYGGEEVPERLLALDIRKADLLYSSIYCFSLHQLVFDVSILISFQAGSKFHFRNLPIQGHHVM
jgi:hypothetical protein